MKGRLINQSPFHYGVGVGVRVGVLVGVRVGVRVEVGVRVGVRGFSVRAGVTVAVGVTISAKRSSASVRISGVMTSAGKFNKNCQSAAALASSLRASYTVAAQ